jgi:hypothetical protein
MMIEPHMDGKTVTVTVDNEEASTERWRDADDRVALFAPDGAAFAQRLLHANTCSSATRLTTSVRWWRVFMWPVSHR